MAQKISKFVSFEPQIVKILLPSLNSWIHESMLAVDKAFPTQYILFAEIKTFRLAIMQDFNACINVQFF